MKKAGWVTGCWVWLGTAALLAAAGCGAPQRGEQPTGLEQHAMSVDELKRYSEAEGLLSSPDLQTREKAAVALLSMDSPRAVEAVLTQLRKATDPQVKVSIINAVAFVGDRRCFQALLGAVKDPDPEAREAAAQALGRFSRPAEIDAIVALVSSPDTPPPDQAFLLRAMGDGMFVRATPALLKGLESPSADVREAAWYALKVISGRKYEPEPSRWVLWWEANRKTAREEILERRTKDLKMELAAGIGRIEEAEAQADELSELAKAAPQGAPGLLLKALGSRHERVRECAALRLAADEPRDQVTPDLDDREVHSILRRALEDDLVSVRLAALGLISRSRSAARDRLLLVALRDQNPAVLVKAIEATTPDMGEPAVTLILAALASPHQEVREAAANALGKMGSARAGQPLVDVLKDEEENVRWYAVESLRKLGAVRAVPELCSLLRSDESARVREIVATTLGELDQPAAVPALKEALDDPVERVQVRAVEALQMLARDDFDRMLIIAEALAQRGHNRAARDVLGKVIEDFGGQARFQTRLMEVRGKLAEALVALNDPGAAAEVYAQMESLSGGDPAIRSKLVQCWIAAGQTSQVVEAAKGWLAGAGDNGLGRAVKSGCEAARQLLSAGHVSLAAQLLAPLQEAAERAGGGVLVEMVRQLKADVEAREPAP